MRIGGQRAVFETCGRTQGKAVWAWKRKTDGGGAASDRYFAMVSAGFRGEFQNRAGDGISGEEWFRSTNRLCDYAAEKGTESGCMMRIGILDRRGGMVIKTEEYRASFLEMREYTAQSGRIGTEKDVASFAIVFEEGICGRYAL